MTSHLTTQTNHSDMDDAMEDEPESQTIAEEGPSAGVFNPPSVNNERVLSGESYTHLSAVPAALIADMSTECVLGVDEAGRGPVLGIRTQPPPKHPNPNNRQAQWSTDSSTSPSPSTTPS